MSKYIIDLPDNCSWVQWVMTSDKDGHAYFDFKSPEDLTTLDKELDDSYQKGLEEGKKQAKVQAHLDVCHDIERVAHGNYQKGLDDAWETIREIARTTYAQRSEIFDGQQDILSIVQKFSPSEAIAKLREYEQQKADAEIKVGDEIKNTLELMNNAVGYFIEPTNNEYYRVLRYVNGKIDIVAWHKENCVRTGNTVMRSSECM